MNEGSYDITIVGAGPAGSSAAIRLARAGMKVLLVEKSAFPRQKLCGEFVSPECLAHFAELGVLPELTAIGGTELLETVFYSRSGRSIRIDNAVFTHDQHAALGVSRAEMDLALLQGAIRSGVDVRTECRLLRFDREASDRIRLRFRMPDAESSVTTRFAIDATGRSRSLARIIRPSVTPGRAAYVAFKAHLRGASIEPGVCEIYSYDGGYGGCGRVENNLFNICFIARSSSVVANDKDPLKVFRHVVFRNSRAERALRESSVETPWISVPISGYGRADLTPAEGVLCIGDSASFIDPFTGSGILMALESAKVATNSMVDHRGELQRTSDVAATYQQNYEIAFQRRLFLCSMLRWAAFFPTLADGLIGILAKSKALRRSIARRTRN